MPTAPMVVSDAWRLIHDWLDRHSPTLRRKLRAPATDKAIAQLEKTVGVSLPDDFKASYRIHDGTESWPGAIIGCCAAELRSMTASRRWTKPTRSRSSIHAPQPSGPRCAIRRSSTASSARIRVIGAPSVATRPAIPHIPATPQQPRRDRLAAPPRPNYRAHRAFHRGSAS